jgi:hypothetical protein
VEILDEDTKDMEIAILLASYSVKIISYTIKNVAFNITQLELVQNVIESLSKVIEAVSYEAIIVNILLFTQQQELLVEVKALFDQVEESLESLISKSTVSDIESESSSLIINTTINITSLLQFLGMTWFPESSVCAADT